MKRPDKFPEFANNDELDSINGQPNIIEPSDSIKNSGWNRKQDVYKQYLNWLHRTNNEWVVWLDSLIDPVINEDFTTVINQAVRTIDSPTFVNLNLISDNSNPDIIFKRATEILKDDVIGSLKVIGNNETDSRAIIDFNSSENWGTNANGTYIRFLTTESLTLSTTEKLRITDVGNVGIGTTNPLQKLHIEGGIFTTGKIGIGTVNPTQELELNGDGYGIRIVDSNDNSVIVDLFHQKLGGGVLQLSRESDNICTAQISSYSTLPTFFNGSNVGIGTTNPTYQLQLSLDSAAKPSTNTWTVASDIRIKKNIENFSKYGLSELLKLRPVKFKYNGLGGFIDDNKFHIGYIAQEVEQIIPEMVSSVKTKLNINDEEEIDLKNVNTHLLTFAIIEALREIKNQSDEKDIKILNLQKDIYDILLRINSLENKVS